MVKQNDLMSQIIVLLPHQQVAGMRIAVNKAMLVDHITEDGD